MPTERLYNINTFQPCLEVKNINFLNFDDFYWAPDYIIVLQKLPHAMPSL